MLIDTSILIDHLRGRRLAKQFVLSLQASVGLTASVIVAAELLSGARDRAEQREIDRLLKLFNVEEVLAGDGTVALDFLRQHRLAADELTGLGTPKVNALVPYLATAVAPEPDSLGLVALGAGLFLRRRRA